MCNPCDGFQIFGWFIGALVAFRNHRRLMALGRWLARVAPVKLVATCNDEVWWDDHSWGDSTRHYKRIDAINEKKEQFLLVDEAEPRKLEDLVWCSYYQNWEYDKDRAARERRNKRTLEFARSPEKGWKKC